MHSSQIKDERDILNSIKSDIDTSVNNLFPKNSNLTWVSTVDLGKHVFVFRLLDTSSTDRIDIKQKYPQLHEKIESVLKDFKNKYSYFTEIKKPRPAYKGDNSTPFSHLKYWMNYDRNAFLETEKATESAIDDTDYLMTEDDLQAYSDTADTQETDQKPPEGTVYGTTSGNIIFEPTISKTKLKNVLGLVKHGVEGVEISNSEFRKALRLNPDLNNAVKRSALHRLNDTEDINEIKNALDDLRESKEIGNAIIADDDEEEYRIKPVKKIASHKKIVSFPRRKVPIGF